MTHQVIVCRGCVTGRDLAEGLRLDGYALTETECMSGCTRASTVAFRATGKTAYLFGDLGVADLADLTAFARLYRASPDGTFADARGLGGLRWKAIARIPG